LVGQTLSFSVLKARHREIRTSTAYAKTVPELDDSSEKDQMKLFFDRLVKLDVDKVIYKSIWSEFSGSVRILLENKYVFAPFWRYQQGEVSKNEWEMWFAASRKLTQKSFMKQDTVSVLSSLFPRIYTLRNQIIHGGATWQSGVNRDQVRDCMRILETLVPVFISLMMEDIHGNWDMPAYPVVSE